jgi:hypothetical protein
LPLYELYQGALSAEKKEKQLQQDVATMEHQLKTLNSNLEAAFGMVKKNNE